MVNIIERFVRTLGNKRNFSLEVKGQELRKNRRVVAIKICDTILVDPIELDINELNALKECSRVNGIKVVDTTVDTIYNIKKALREGDIDYINRVL